jgi:hypothetical protein
MARRLIRDASEVLNVLTDDEKSAAIARSTLDLWKRNDLCCVNLVNESEQPRGLLLDTSRRSIVLCGGLSWLRRGSTVYSPRGGHLEVLGTCSGLLWLRGSRTATAATSNKEFHSAYKASGDMMLFGFTRTQCSSLLPLDGKSSFDVMGGGDAKLFSSKRFLQIEENVLLSKDENERRRVFKYWWPRAFPSWFLETTTTNTLEEKRRPESAVLSSKQSRTNTPETTTRPKHPVKKTTTSSPKWTKEQDESLIHLMNSLACCGKISETNLRPEDLYFEEKDVHFQAMYPLLANVSRQKLLLRASLLIWINVRVLSLLPFMSISNRVRHVLFGTTKRVMFLWTMTRASPAKNLSSSRDLRGLARDINAGTMSGFTTRSNCVGLPRLIPDRKCELQKRERQFRFLGRTVGYALRVHRIFPIIDCVLDEDNLDSSAQELLRRLKVMRDSNELCAEDFNSALESLCPEAAWTVSKIGGDDDISYDDDDDDNDDDCLGNSKKFVHFDNIEVFEREVIEKRRVEWSRELESLRSGLCDYISRVALTYLCINEIVSLVSGRSYSLIDMATCLQKCSQYSSPYHKTHPNVLRWWRVLTSSKLTSKQRYTILNLVVVPALCSSAENTAVLKIAPPPPPLIFAFSSDPLRVAVDDSAKPRADLRTRCLYLPLYSSDKMLMSALIKVAGE